MSLKGAFTQAIVSNKDPEQSSYPVYPLGEYLQNFLNMLSQKLS
jgi:hypothetical protein